MRAPQTPVPRPAIVEQSAAPLATPAPPRPSKPPSPRLRRASCEPAPPPHFRLPKLHLHAWDVSCRASRDYLRAIDAGATLEEYVQVVVRLLYRPGSAMPPTRSITFVVRPPGAMADMVAFTEGKELDDDHKEIHMSADHINRVPQEGRRLEIIGVLAHEMVHCLQWNACGTAPGGLIEGIADWVRLNCGLAPPHWKARRDLDGDWDEGYETTGYFLDYLEDRFGYGTVKRINEALRDQKYEEGPFWKGLFNESVKKLWRDYCRPHHDQGRDHDDEGAAAAGDSGLVVQDGDSVTKAERHSEKPTKTTDTLHSASKDAQDLSDCRQDPSTT